MTITFCFINIKITKYAVISVNVQYQCGTFSLAMVKRNTHEHTLMLQNLLKLTETTDQHVHTCALLPAVCSIKASSNVTAEGSLDAFVWYHLIQ